jgi:gamma-glutamyltranspeptidase
MRNGEVAAVGTRITQPQLARTLETLGREGVDSFCPAACEQLIARVHEMGGN